MSRCENSGTCTFFDSGTMAVSAEMAALRDCYCRDDKEHCARYLVKKRISQGYFLPEDQSLDQVGRYLMDMRPTDHQMARQLIGMMVQ